MLAFGFYTVSVRFLSYLPGVLKNRVRCWLALYGAGWWWLGLAGAVWRWLALAGAGWLAGWLPRWRWLAGFLAQAHGATAAGMATKSPW